MASKEKDQPAAPEAGVTQMLDVFEALDEPVYLSDPASHEILYVNPALRVLAGDVVGRKCHEALRRRSKPCPLCTNNRIMGANVGRAHVWDYHDDTTGRWYHCIDRAVPWRDGRMVRCSIAIDVSDRKEAEQRLRQRTEDLRLVNLLNEAANRGDSLHDVVELLAAETKRRFACNGVTVYLLSDDRRELLLQNLTLPPKVRLAVEKLLGMATIPEVRVPLTDGSLHASMMAQGRPTLTNDADTIVRLVSEHTQSPALRALVPAAARLIGITSAISIPLVTQGEPIGLVSVSRGSPFGAEDVERFVAVSTQLAALLRRYRAEQALRESEEKFRILSEQSPNMIWINCRGRIVYVNKACLDTMGYTREEFCAPDFDFMSLIAPEYHDAIRRAFVSHSRGEDVPPYEYVLITRDGGRIDALTTTRLIDYGGEHAILGTVLDVSARKAAEREREQARQQLAQAERLNAVGATAAGLAHDFNNLLMGIRGFAEMIDVTIGKDHPAHADIGQIYAVAERANELTRQMLLFGRKQAVPLAPESLNAVIDGLRPVIQRTVGDRVRLDVHLAPDLWQTRLNRGQVEQALVNLTLNAHDAMPDGGTLTLTTANVTLDEAGAKRIPGGRPGAYVVLGVDDTGCGMDEATLERAFEPFFTTKPRKRGSGLGLAVVYGTVRQHDGMVTVESSPGKGASFRLFLPASGEGAGPAPVTAD